MQHRIILFIAFFASGTVAACGAGSGGARGDGGSDGGGGGQGQTANGLPLDQACVQWCEKEVACNTPGGVNQGRCNLDCVTVAGHFRQDFRDALFRCYVDNKRTACDGDANSCFGAADRSLILRDVDSAFTTACHPVESSCSHPGLCPIPKRYQEALIADGYSCLSMACIDAWHCFEQKFGLYYDAYFWGF